MQGPGSGTDTDLSYTESYTSNAGSYISYKVVNASHMDSCCSYNVQLRQHIELLPATPTATPATMTARPVISFATPGAQAATPAKMDGNGKLHGHQSLLR